MRNLRYTLLSAIIFLALFGGAGSAWAANEPLILYTDIISGPNTGGEDNNGAYLSIFGKNFGDNLDNVTITIGGGQVARKIYLGASLGRPDVQQLSVQLGPNAQTGAIKLSVNGSDSNTDHTFTVRPGDFYFMSLNGNNTSGAVNDITKPYRCANYVVSLPGFGAGDFLVIRGGTYDLTSVANECVNYGGSNRWLTLPVKSGALNNEITLYGYPGEVPVIDWGLGEDQGPSGIKGSNEDYWNIANIAFDVRDHGASSLEFGFYYGTNSNDFFRVVNVRHRGGMFANKSGGVNSWSLNRCGNIKIYGCDTGLQSPKALPGLGSHVWYISHEYTNGDIGWNYIHDNAYGRGVLQMAGDGWAPTYLGGGTTYSWTLSSQGTGEYFLRLADGSNPNINHPDRVSLGGSGARLREVGSLPSDSWGYGDNDSLGYSTIYVRMHDDADPDTELPGGVSYYSDVTWGDNTNVKVHDNIFRNLPQSPILFGGGSNEIYVYNNLFVNGCTACSLEAGTGLIALRGYGAGFGNYHLYNNTIVDGPTRGSMFEMGFDNNVYPESITLLNNIIVTGHDTCAYATTPKVGTTVTSNNNIWYGSSQTDRTWWGANDRVLDPKFYNLSGGDFHLQATSPAIDAGTSSVAALVNRDFDFRSRPMDGNSNGTAEFDIGAFEYDGTYIPPTADTTPPSPPANLSVI